MSFQATPTNTLGVPSPSLGVNKFDMRTYFASKISRLFLHQYVLFHLAQLFIRVNSGYLFPKCWNWQICHTHLALNFHFGPLAVSYELFPRWNQRQLARFLLDRTQQYTPVLFAKTPCELPPVKKLLSGHYVVSSPDTKFFARALRPCQKIGSGHFHYENWGMFTYGGQ